MTDTSWRACRKKPLVVHVRDAVPGEEIFTREGLQIAQPDDLVMRGVDGELYPIGRAIFLRTYDLVQEDTHRGLDPAELPRTPEGWNALVSHTGFEWDLDYDQTWKVVGPENQIKLDSPGEPSPCYVLMDQSPYVRAPDSPLEIRLAELVVRRNRAEGLGAS